MERHNRITPSYPSISQSNNSSSPYLSLNPKPHPPIGSFYLRPQAETPRRLSRRTDDAELSIFDAERYFNDIQITDKNEITSIHCSSSISSVDSYAKNYRNGYVATPTPSSEASWNSQSGLLCNPPNSVKVVKMRSFSLREKPKMPASPSRRMFSLRCPCVGKKSLEVDEKFSEPRSPVCGKSDVNMSHVTNKLQRTQSEDDSLSSIVPLEELTKVRITSGSVWPKEKDFVHSPSKLFPKKPPAPFQNEITRTISNPRVFTFPNPPINKPIKPMSSIEPPRESIEVFGAKPPKARLILKTDEEQMSDTSSDLFELDSFCANSYGTTSYGRRRDSLDDLLDPRRLEQMHVGVRRNSDETAQSECCYPPSEASIQWSVTTAEGFDRASVANFSSAASDFDELRFIQQEQSRLDKKKTVVSGGAIGGGLLSCRGDKAVQVRCNSDNRPVHMR